MENYLRTRIKARLEATGISPFEAARRIGAERSFVNDLLIGKKDSIRQKAIPALAKVLGCDADYLIGAQATPRAIPTGGDRPRPGHEPMPIMGICEFGVWRPVPIGPIDAAALFPYPRYPAERQVSFIVRDDHAERFSVSGGDYLITVLGEPFRSGDLVIVRRKGPKGTAETTVRKFSDVGFICSGADGGDDIIPEKDPETEILGLVSLVIRSTLGGL